MAKPRRKKSARNRIKTKVTCASAKLSKKSDKKGKKKEKAPRFSALQVQMFKETEKKLKTKIGYQTLKFERDYRKNIPTTDEIAQMGGAIPSAAWMAYTIRVNGLSPEQRNIISKVRRKLISEMNFSLNLDVIPSTERIKKMGEAAAVEELYRNSLHYGSLFQ